MQDVRGGEIALIFQEPMTALNPVFTIGNQIEETLLVHKRATRRTARSKALELLEAVSVPDPARRLREYPHQLSGGLRQRALIAMSLACDPSLVIADEPTTALDVTIQAQILDLLRDLKQRMGLALLLITHDLGVVAEMADRVAVMYAGRIVEEAPVDALFADPKHPYTRGLMSSMPGGAPGTRLHAIQGTVPPLGQLPPGCSFEPRCRERFAPCTRAHPADTILDGGRAVKCYLHGTASELTEPEPMLIAESFVTHAPRSPQSREGVHPQAGVLRRGIRRARRGRRELFDSGRRDVRARRRIRQRKDDDGAVHPAAHRADVRPGVVQR